MSGIFSQIPLLILLRMVAYDKMCHIRLSCLLLIYIYIYIPKITKMKLQSTFLLMVNDHITRSEIIPTFFSGWSHINCLYKHLSVNTFCAYDR